MQGHLSQQRRDAAPAFAGQPLPNRRRQIAHRGIRANAPTRTALGTRFSVIRRAPSNYERQCQWDIERAFRTSKSLFETRPIYHKLDETIRGHVSCSFLALVLKKELEDRIVAIGEQAADRETTPSASWPDILADLESLTETEVEQDGKRFLLRSPPRSAASLALRAAGVALPPTVRQIAGG
jgi:hypothetical protein